MLLLKESENMVLRASRDLQVLLAIAVFQAAMELTVCLFNLIYT